MEYYHSDDFYPANAIKYSASHQTDVSERVSTILPSITTAILRLYDLFVDFRRGLRFSVFVLEIPL